MSRYFVVVPAIVLLSSCNITGHYQSSGPCEGFHSDQQACLRAAQNSGVIGNVKLGQSLSEVRDAMGKDPEQRTAIADTETWGYLTDYGARRLTEIVFKNGVVQEIRQAPSGH